MEGGAVFQLMDLSEQVGALWWEPWIKVAICLLILK